MGGGGLTSGHIFNQIISVDNLFAAWREFSRGKRRKPDVQQFEFNLEDELFQLHERLRLKIYTPDPYQVFYITDPKLRRIHKASVRDRVLFQAVFRVLYPIFNVSFIFDSYASREGKGTHAGVNRLEQFLTKASANHREKVWALKCDVRKFFDSIDHVILFSLIQKKINDSDALRLIRIIINSFHIPESPAYQVKRPSDLVCGKGLPLGNVTSQLFANIYLHELDFYIKQRLNVKFYLRYCDDFVIIANSQEQLESYLLTLRAFLGNYLQLALHPNKIEIRSYGQGIDFLGYVLRPYHRTLRTRTKQRIFRRMTDSNQASYLGILKHCNGYNQEQLLLAKMNGTVYYP